MRAEERFELDNGLQVVLEPGGSSRFFTAVLVCPLPAEMSDRDVAAAALLNRLIWSGGTGLGTSLKQYEYRMIALRFGGSIGSQLLPDAMLIHYTLPSRHLDAALNYLAQQWSGLELERQQIDRARRRIEAEKQASMVSSVLNQLMREIEPRLWSDLRYRYRSYGSDAAMRAVGESDIQRIYALMRRPSRWTLIVTGDVETTRLRALAEEALGALEPAETEPISANPGEAPKLGARLRLPADLSKRHAVLCFRLPPAVDSGVEGPALLARYIERSPAATALRSELGPGAEFSVGIELRRESGILYLYAACSGENLSGDLAARLAELVRSVAMEDPDKKSLEAARKQLLISYWSRRQSAQSYAVWLGGRAAIGLDADDFATVLGKLGGGELRALAGKLLTAENRLTLVTVKQ